MLNFILLSGEMYFIMFIQRIKAYGGDFWTSEQFPYPYVKHEHEKYMVTNVTY